MKYTANQKLRKLVPYRPETEVSPIRLDANESFLSVPDALMRTVSEKIASVDFNRYPDPFAAGVCRAFGRWIGVGPEYITAANGSDELISLLFGSFMQKGDRVLILDPDFSMYRVYCSIFECEPVVLKKKPGWNVTADEIIEAAGRNSVEMVIFSNPCNPTGQGISRGDVLKIADRLNCLVVVDEAYMDFWNQPAVAEAPKRENMIVLKTCSKVGLAALRLGFAVACPALTGYLRSAKSPYNVNSLTQAAGRAVLEEANFLKSAAERIKASRDALYGGLLELQTEQLRVLPTHTNFVPVLTPRAEELHAGLKKKGISVRLFPGFLRVTAGSPEENGALLGALKELCGQIYSGKDVP